MRDKSFNDKILNSLIFAESELCKLFTKYKGWAISGEYTDSECLELVSGTTHLYATSLQLEKIVKDLIIKTEKENDNEKG